MEQQKLDELIKKKYDACPLKSKEIFPFSYLAKFRIELYCLEREYNSNQENLSTEQLKRLSTLHRRLGGMRVALGVLSPFAIYAATHITKHDNLESTILGIATGGFAIAGSLMANLGIAEVYKAKIVDTQVKLRS